MYTLNLTHFALLACSVVQDFHHLSQAAPTRLGTSDGILGHKVLALVSSTLKPQTTCRGWPTRWSGWRFRRWGGSSTSNLLETHLITEIARSAKFCHMSSGWFDRTEPPLSASLPRQIYNVHQHLLLCKLWWLSRQISTGNRNLHDTNRATCEVRGVCTIIRWKCFSKNMNL